MLKPRTRYLYGLNASQRQFWPAVSLPCKMGPGAALGLALARVQPCTRSQTTQKTARHNQWFSPAHGCLAWLPRAGQSEATVHGPVTSSRTNFPGPE